MMAPDGTSWFLQETLLDQNLLQRQSKMSMKFSHELRRAIPFRRLRGTELDEQYVYNIQVSAIGIPGGR